MTRSMILLPEGEVPCCGKRVQSQLRENKKNANAGLIKGAARQHPLKQSPVAVPFWAAL